ncbi:YwpF family protein [Bacillus sp. FJAT-27245]|uniref:YwpF family protein n=1 Tax=Bacillus sp. FJAT-27245 TaxID=1684144 RepID=UPI0006A77E75|nr:YwpF family protein [Bacillus sp. FJAT-27245]
MKTFKLVSLEILDGEESTEINLESGLIINKEDEHSNWLLEAYTGLEHHDYFKNLSDTGNEFIVQAVITHKDNDPAYFQTRVCSLKKFEEHISVLLEGQLRKTKNNYAEILLGQLLDQGYKGNILLDEFKDKMQRKPKLKTRKTEV